MQDLIIINSKSALSRIVSAAALLIVLIYGLFAVRWQLGNMLAGLTSPADANAAEIADLSAGWAPSDPYASWLQSAVGVDDIRNEPGSPMAGFEQTIRLAPNDYRWRVELARAYEQNDMPEKAEAEFKKAVELAPAYASVRWTLGNFYLRQNRSDEAIAELKKAADNNQGYRDQVFSLVWDFFGKDAAKVEGMAGQRVEAKVRLAYFFAARGRAADSLRNWNALSDAEKAANPDTAKAIAHGLFLQRYYPQSLEFARQLGIDPDAQPEMVTNASFEKGMGEDKDARFGWEILRNDTKFEVAGESKVKHDGARSLKVTFRTYTKPALGNLLQTIVVEPNKRYRLSFWVRTENLKSAGGPLLEVLNANDDKLVTRSQVYPSGTNDWQQIAVDFITPENCSGLTIRTARAYCGEECPITGVFWYDDFALARL